MTRLLAPDPTGSAPSPAGPRPTSVKVADYVDLGAGRPGDDGLARARADLAPPKDARGEWVRRRVVVDGGTLHLAYPILHDDDYLSFVSTDGTGAIQADHCGPLTFIDRSIWRGRSASPDHSFPLGGVLDATTPAGRSGLRSLGVAHVAFWDSPWDLGPAGGWQAVGDLTVDFALAGDLDNGQCMGLYDYGEGCIWYIYTRIPDTIGVIYVTDTIGVGRFSFAAPKGPDGIRRVSVRFGPKAPAHVAFANGVQVPLAQDIRPPAGATFRPNDSGILPFQVFNSGEIVAATLDGKPEPNLALVGLRLTSGQVYAESGVGTPQARLDEAAITDNNRLFRAESGGRTFALLAHDADTAARPGNRWVKYRAADGTPGYGAWFMPSMGVGGDGNIGGAEYRNIILRGRGRGTGIAIGRAYGLRVSDAAIRGGATGIGGPSMGPSWYTQVDHTALEGQSLYCASFRGQIVTLSDMTFAPVAGIARFVECDATIRGAFATAQSSGPDTFRLVGGGNGYGCRLGLAGVVFDNESSGFPTNAFMAIRRRGGGSPIDVGLDRVTVAALGRSAALVKVDDAKAPQPATAPNAIRARAVWVQSVVHRATYDGPPLAPASAGGISAAGASGWQVDLSGVIGRPEDAIAIPKVTTPPAATPGP